MNIKPRRGYIHVQIIKEDIQRGGSNLIPTTGKDTSFYNRHKLLAFHPDDEHCKGLEIGAIVVITTAGFQMGIPGLIKHNGKWIETFLIMSNQIMAEIEGDIGEDLPRSQGEIIVSGSKKVN